MGIAGSLRGESYNRCALRAAAQLAAKGATVDIFELDGIPGFSQDHEQNPPAKVVELKRRVRDTDAIIIVTPECNYSIPGVFEEHDRLGIATVRRQRQAGSDYGASVGMIRTARAQYHLRQMMMFLNMFPFNQPEVMIGNAADRFDAEGNLTDETAKQFIRKLLQSLIDSTRRIGAVHESISTAFI
jgi:chromate reductase